MISTREGFADRHISANRWGSRFFVSIAGCSLGTGMLSATVGVHLPGGRHDAGDLVFETRAVPRKEV